MKNPYVIQAQHYGSSYWGPNRGGYYASLLSAGVYSKEEAEQIARRSGPSSISPERREVALPLRDELARQNGKGTVGELLLKAPAMMLARLIAELCPDTCAAGHRPGARPRCGDLYHPGDAFPCPMSGVWRFAEHEKLADEVLEIIRCSKGEADAA